MDSVDPQPYIDKVLGSINKASAAKQLIIGASSGWFTGYLAMKIGKAAACAVGGGIIVLELASQKGYIKINWDKINRQIDQVADKVEESVTNQRSSLSNKIEHYVDNKLDKAEGFVKKQQTKAKGWLSSHTKTSYKLQEIHIFLASFAAGFAIGIAIS